ncbi:MAG: class A beta-lactamase-related serine hydrolase [Sphingomonadales bacterium]|nr:MAG: class A beta-lactamase-related serine hydrolase [Sphingomonadales bacterium]
MVRAALLAATLLFTGTAAAQTVEPDAVSLARLDGFAQGLTLAGKFSGVVLIARGDEVVFEHAYGPIDPGKDPLATADTRYNLASAGKMFTTVAILQQIAAGKLTLDTRVGEVLKTYRNRDFANTVSVRQLLMHTSGAGDIDLFDAGNAANRARVRTVADMVAMHDDRPPAFAPGTKQQYGNFAFVILGRMVELLSGEGYEAYVARHILRPAGMTRTGFVDCADPAPDLARGYASVEGKQVINCETLPNRGFPAGGEVSTARDMHRFMRALQTGKLVPLPLLADATRTHQAFMGLGFFATGYGEGVPTRDFRWGHGGSADGICTDVRAYPETGEIVIVLANVSPPACYPVANFLHDSWNIRTAK